MSKDSLSSTTLTKSMALLSELADAGSPLTLTELIRRTGLPKSTTHRILSILDNERLVHNSTPIPVLIGSDTGS